MYDEAGGENQNFKKLGTNKDETGTLVNKICVHELIDELDERERKIIILRYFKGKLKVKLL